MLKKCLLPLFLFLMFFSFHACPEQGPRLEAVGEPWEFKGIQKGDIAEKEFFIKNSGDKELVIDRVNSCCGYKVDGISSWAILPGEKAGIKVISDTSRKDPGQDRKKITIYSNDAVRDRTEISVATFIVEPGSNGQRPSARSISAPGLKKRLDSGQDVNILDVREVIEYEDYRLPGSLNIPKSVYDRDAQSFWDRMKFTKQDEIVVCCSGGYRSAFIADRMKDKGYDVYNLSGGLTALKNLGQGFIDSEGKVTAGPILISISLKDAHDKYVSQDNAEIIWLDARSRGEYDKGHIKGAVNIELPLIKEKIKDIPGDKQVIIYCTDNECGQSETAGRILIEHGKDPSSVKILKEGFNAWQKAGYPVSISNKRVSE